MKKALLIIILVLASMQAYGLECGPPAQFHGALTIESVDAPIGTEVRALFGEEVKGTYETIVVGEYGLDGESTDFYVDCDNFGDLITFEVKVNGNWLDTGDSKQCVCSAANELDLNVEDVPVSDADDDGFTVDQGDCDDNDPEVYPQAEDICDGKDNDCDDSTDEDHVASATACGVGACASEGELQCVGGAIIDSCTPGTPAADDATCNLVDEDCDGTADEDYVVSATACGVGDCAAAGEMTCESGQEVDSCEAGAPAQNDATCDGVDDDCDGTDDEDYVPTATACGAGECARAGEMICEAGALFDTCIPGEEATEVCNGVDDNCNDIIDEGAEICSANDFVYDECDGNYNNYYSFTSVCEGQSGCTEAPLDFETVETCDEGCGATCLNDEDCADSLCPVDRCYEGVFRDYAEGVANTCVDCACSSNLCTYTEPYDSEVCLDGIDNDCDEKIDERCSAVGEACAEDYHCDFGLECTEGLCTAIEMTCDIHYPIDLDAGWNLFGFPSCDAMPVADGLESIEGQFGDVFSLVDGEWLAYNAQAPPELNTLKTLNPFQGLYINMNEAGTLIV